MAEQQLIFISVETKTMKSGKPYKVYKANDGVYSCFEEKVFQELDKNINNLILVDILDKGAYKNVKGFIKTLNGSPQQNVSQQLQQTQPIVAQALALEKPIKISISQSAKGFAYINEVTIRSDTIEEAKALLYNAIMIAEDKVSEMNLKEEMEKQENEPKD